MALCTIKDARPRPVQKPPRVYVDSEENKEDLRNVMGAEGKPRDTFLLGWGSDSERDDYDEHHNDYNEDLITAPENPPKISNKKRADRAAFQEWISLNQKEVTENTRTPAAQEERPKHLSVAQLVKENENRKIIENPREYQIELFERAKEKNIIAVLPTGSGKTLIAAMLLRHVLEKEVGDRRRGGSPRRVAFFLVEKVALAMQQHAVLACNLDFPMEAFCGEMVEHSWRKEFWAEKWENNMAIVCTAAILQECLAKSFIRMEQINLIIFDEAHHCKGKHPYARIIKDFYIPEKDLEKRPRIFGMTASPADANTDTHLAAHHLEGLMHAEIATIPEESASYKQIEKDVVELDCKYPRLKDPFCTPLGAAILNHVNGNSLFTKPLAFSADATVALGPWCADRYWQLLLTDDMIAKLATLTRRDYLHQTSGPTSAAAVESLRGIIRQYQLPPLRKDDAHLSSKVLCLLSHLNARYRTRCDYKTIIFVDQRNTAVLLNDLLRRPDIAPVSLKAAPLVGTQVDVATFPMSYREQMITIARFKSGEYNCIIATSVAEEGIDIPDCNCVIRFDLFNSAIQYVQSKGRARKTHSEYLCLIESGNPKHTRLRIRTASDLAAIRDFCQTLPAERKIVGWDPEAFIMTAERHHKSHLVESTGARLTWAGSLTVLAAFTASLQHGEEILSPTYIVTPDQQQFICEVQMPLKSPIPSTMGTYQRTKADARCSAAFTLCMELLKHGHIDKHLQPFASKRLPAMRNARLAISSKKDSEYHMRIKPNVWSRRGPISSLYATVLTLEDPTAVDRATRPLVLVTRERLPDLPTIPLFFGNGQKTRAHPISIEAPMQLESDDVEALKVFTFRFFRDIFSKHFEGSTEDVPYFLAPAAVHHDSPRANDPRSLIDWDHIRSTKDQEYVSWDETTPMDFFRDKFVVDLHAGSRKMYLRGVRPDLKPRDPVPDGVPDPGHKPWKEVEHNILEYSVSLWMASRLRRTWREDQPVVEAEVVSLRRNLLDEAEEVTDVSSNICYVIVEPLRISTLPVDVVAMAITFPAIIHRIESTMIALDACDLIGLNIPPNLALEAMTKDSDNSDEHDQEKINFQAGMGANYERLEFLGDCFLKMAATISLFTRIPDSNEFEYHVERMLLICNKNLFNAALGKGLQEYVRSKSFSRRNWYPDGLKMTKGKSIKTRNIHSLADKSVADICEALIGASYLTTGEGNFDMAIKAVTALVKNKRHDAESWPEYYAAFNMPAWQMAEPTPIQQELAEHIEQQMGYRFKSPALLRSAFKHPSYPRAYEDVPHYQRLEFLGDALLDMVCVDFLFKRFPHADPQWLTEHKMAMVSNHFLGSLCVSLGFSKRILHFKSEMTGQIKEYTELLHIARDEAGAEAARTGTPLAANYWLNVAAPPKFLSDVVEAYIGAIFVDSEYDYGQVQKFFEEHVRPFFTDMALYDSFAKRHPVTMLAQIMQQKFGCRHWRLLLSEVPELVQDVGAHAMCSSQVICGFMVHGEVVEHAKSASGRYAKIAVAKRALHILEKFEGIPEFKEEFGCDCSSDCEGPQMGGKAGELDLELDLDEHGTAC